MVVLKFMEIVSFFNYYYFFFTSMQQVFIKNGIAT